MLNLQREMHRKRERSVEKDAERETQKAGREGEPQRREAERF